MSESGFSGFRFARLAVFRHNGIFRRALAGQRRAGGILKILYSPRIPVLTQANQRNLSLAINTRLRDPARFANRASPSHPARSPRHSREGGNPEVGEPRRRPKSSMNSRQRIPSRFMGRGRESSGVIPVKTGTADPFPLYGLLLWLTAFQFSAVAEDRSAESGAREHSAARYVGGVCMDAESWGEGLPVAEDSAGCGWRRVGWRKRVHARTAAVSEPAWGSSANPMRAEFADRIKVG